MLDRVKTLKIVLGDIMPVIQKLRNTASRGCWCTVKALRIAPKQYDESVTTKQDAVGKNLIDSLDRTVAAATGRGFKSRQPESKDSKRGSRCAVDTSCRASSLVFVSLDSMDRSGRRPRHQHAWVRQSLQIGSGGWDTINACLPCVRRWRASSTGASSFAGIQDQPGTRDGEHVNDWMVSFHVFNQSPPFGAGDCFRDIPRIAEEDLIGNLTPLTPHIDPLLAILVRDISSPLHCPFP
jgi:hypothetical protein